MSSSGLAAALGLTKASSYETHSNPSGSTTCTDISPDLSDTDIEICLKKLFKKDSTTKLKGLNSLLDLLAAKPGRVLVAYLPAWTRLYRVLCVDEDDRRVRALAHAVMLKWVESRGPKMKKLFRHLVKDFVGPWLCARFDSCPLSADSASASWHALVPLANLPRFLLRHLPSLVAHLGPTLAQAPQQLKAAHPLLDADALERLYDRQLSSALRALAFLVSSLDADALSASLSATLAAPSLWKLFSGPRPLVRLACHHFLHAVCQSHPQLLEEPRLFKTAALALFKGFEARDAGNQPQFWATLLRFLSRFPSAFDSALSPKNTLVAPLLKHLRSAACLAPDAVFPNLLVLLSLLPRALVLDPDFVDQLFAALLAALDSPQPLQLVAPALGPAVAQCLLYLLSLEPPAPVAAALLHRVFPLFVKEALARDLRGTDAPFLLVDQAAFVLKRALQRCCDHPAAVAALLQPLQDALVAHLLAPVPPALLAAPSSPFDRLAFLLRALAELSEDLKALCAPLLHRLLATLTNTQQLAPSAQSLALLSGLFQSFRAHMASSTDEWLAFLTALLHSHAAFFRDPSFADAFVDSCLVALAAHPEHMQPWNALVQHCAAQPHLASLLLPRFVGSLSAVDDFKEEEKEEEVEKRAREPKMTLQKCWNCPAIDDYARQRMSQMAHPDSLSFLVAWTKSPLCTPEFHPELVSAWVQCFAPPAATAFDTQQLLALLAVARAILLKVVADAQVVPLLVQLFRLRMHNFEVLLPVPQTPHLSVDSDSSASSSADEGHEFSETRTLLTQCPVARTARCVWRSISPAMRPTILLCLDQLFNCLLHALDHSRIPPSVLTQELLELLQSIGSDPIDALDSHVDRSLFDSFLDLFAVLPEEELTQAFCSLLGKCFAEFRSPIRFPQGLYEMPRAARESLLWRRVLFLEKLLVSLDAPRLVFGTLPETTSSSTSSSHSPVRMDLLCQLLAAYTLADYFDASVASFHNALISSPDAMQFLQEANQFWNVRQQIIEGYFQHSPSVVVAVYEHLVHRALQGGEFWALVLGSVVPIMLQCDATAGADLYATMIQPVLPSTSAAVVVVFQLAKALTSERFDQLELCEAQLATHLRETSVTSPSSALQVWASFIRGFDALGADSGVFTKSKRGAVQALEQASEREHCGEFLSSLLLAIISDTLTRKHLLVSRTMSSLLEWVLPSLSLGHPSRHASVHDALLFVELILNLDDSEQLGQLQLQFRETALLRVLEMLLGAPLPTSPPEYQVYRLACNLLHRWVLSAPLSSAMLTLVGSKLNELGLFLASHFYDFQVLAASLMSAYWSSSSFSISAPVQSSDDTLPIDEADLSFFPNSFRAVICCESQEIMPSSVVGHSSSSSSLSSSSSSSSFSPSASSEFGFLLAWKVIIDLRLHSGNRDLREILTTQVRRKHAFEEILKTIFHNQTGLLTPLVAPPDSPNLWADKSPPGYWLVDPQITDMLCEYLMYGFLRGFPGVVRLWVSDLSDRNLKKRVQNLVTQRYSALLRQLEMQSIRDYPLPPKSSFSITAALTNDEAKALYVHDEVTLSVVFKIPLNYPLQSIQVETSQRMGIAEAQWRRWILSMISMMATQDVQLIDSVLLWKNCMDKHFEGIESCFICYSVFHPTNKSLPRMACRTCKNKFHSACLFRWFSTSHKSVCPLCQTPWLT